MSTLHRAAFLLALASAAYAQFESSSVLGTVQDPRGAAVAGASIKLRNADTGVAAEATTDVNGDYQFFPVRAGRYEVTASADGFQSASSTDVDVKVNARQRLDFTLRLPSVQTTLDVSASPAVVEADSSDRGQVINQQQVVGLPLDGRNYSDLALLVTGVRRSALSDSTQPREGAFNVNGLRSAVNNFILDGVDNNAYGTSNQGLSSQVVQPSPDAIVEFKVQTNNMSAEFGRSAGATVNVALKSGTNRLHGASWEFLRNTDLNAVGFFKPVDNVKPVLNRNQFGATVGGPIRKNKTFFFADYEGYRLIQYSLAFVTLPTLDERQGRMGSTVLDPFTGASYPGGNIPPSVVTPFARKVLDDLPVQNLPGKSSNYKRLVPTRDFSDKADVKLDHYWNSRDNSFFRISQRKDNRFQPGTIPGASGGDGNGYQRTLNQGLAAANTYVLSPTSVLEARFGVTRTLGGKNPLAGGGPDLLAAYGIPGYTTDPRVRGGLNSQDVSGFSAFGRQPTNPQWQYPTVFDPRVSLSKIAGRHTLKIGYELQIIHTEDQDSNPLYGLYTYSGTFSRPKGATATAIYNLTDFMLGAPSQIGVTNLLVAELRQRMQFTYFQDDWKVSSRLTLNLGLRYEYGTPQWEAGNKLSNYDPATNSILLARPGSLFDRALVNPDRNDFAPRIGMAFSVTPKTVIRSGYGISYNHFTRAGTSNLLAFDGPQQVSVNIEQQPADKGFLKMQDGLPAGITDPSNFDPRIGGVKWLPQDTRTGYVQNWFFSVQREIAGQTLLDVAYVGNHALKQLLVYDLNQALPNLPGQSLTVNARRPNQAFSAISAAGPDGWSIYHALQVRLEHRWSHGFYVLNSFSWSKALDNSADALETGNGDTVYPQNSLDFRSNKGISSFDQPFTNVTSAVWELPLGHGRKWGSGLPALADAVVGGWRLGAIDNMWSGQPVDLVWTVPPQFQVSSDVTMRPNVLGPVMLPAGQRTVDQSFIPANVAIPKDASHPFGNAGRNTARGFPYYGANLSLQKDFRLPREGMRLQFRAEAFNVLNKTNFEAPQGNRSAVAFGQVRVAYPARQIQFGLKLYW